MPLFFLMATVINCTYAGLGWITIRNGDMALHRQYMWRAWLPVISSILGTRAVVLGVFVNLLSVEQFRESLVPATAWFIFALSHVFIHIFIDNAQKVKPKVQ
jgi:hypothetical protein